MNGSSDAAAVPAGDAGEAVTNAKQVLNGSGPAASASASASAASSAVASGTETSSASAPAPAPAASSAVASSGGLENAASGAAAGGGGARARSPRPSPRPKKRQRPSLATAAATTATSVHATVKNSDDEADAASNEQDETSAAKDAFYLRHQNKALASELRSYKRQIDLLVAERNNRRDRCDEAREGVDKLAEIWAEVEGCVKTALVGLELPEAVAAAVKKEEGALAEADGVGVGSGSTAESSAGGPPSTGTGDGVETVSALVASLIRLAEAPLILPPPARDDGASGSARPKKEETDDAAMDIDGVGNNAARTAAKVEEDERREAQYVKADLIDLSRSAASVASRADALRNALVPLLRNALSSASATVEKLSAVDPLLEPSSLRRDIAALQNQLGEKESKLAELTFARDEAAQGERRVRRGLYRIASGRMKLSDVIKAVEMEDGSTLFQEFAKEEATMAAASLSSPVAASAVSMPGAADSSVDSVEVGQLRKRLQDLEEIADSRENRISGLLMEREDCIKQINDLRLEKADTHSEPISVDDVKRSDLFTETATNLAKVEAQCAQLQKAFDDVNQRWAKAKGDLDLAQKAIKEMEESHVKRLEEISTTGIAADKGGDAAAAADAADTSDGNFNRDSAEKAYISDAKKIAELEHKLAQALENVRQAETVRESLAEANRINETISAKLDEYQAKNSALIQAKAAARAAEIAGTASADAKGEDDNVVQKLKAEHRKMRKELQAALQSKDNARAKQERAERDRDNLMKTNARLLAQSAEKDEMNARSLSTILHLNQMSEQLTQEKELLEQKAKASEQLSLSARLAANARERSEEEEQKDRDAVEKEAREAKDRFDALLAEKEEIAGKLTQTQAQSAAITKDLNVAKSRCDELAKESTAAEEEKSRLMDSVAVAKKEAAEAAKQAATVCAHMASAGGGKAGVNSEFTMEQMETQVKVLKGRLACNVCNERDKQVILLRCRHMFCRPCVDKNIKNRSRKCPGCGQRFDMKDVGDVWL